MPKPIVSYTVESHGVLNALARLGPAAQGVVTRASHETALAIQANAQRLIRKRTGETAAGIVVRKDYPGTGYIVATADTLPGEVVEQRRALVRSDPKKYANLKRRINAKYYQEEHVGLYLEHGTIQGEPGSHSSEAHPFFFPAVEMERDGHLRRIREGLDDEIAASGLGD